MANIKIAVLNQYSELPNNEVKKAVTDLQTQVTRDFYPAWGIDADLTFYPNGNPPADAWQLVILNNSDQANALGYHDLTDSGLPLGKVFAGTDAQSGNSWTVTASHELLEMLADPDINLTVLTQDNNGGGVLFAYENCDACESDQYAYDINGTKVSDFVFPAWFEAFHRPGTQYDYCKHISQPFQLLPGGYIGIFRINSGSGWEQMYPSNARLDYNMRAHIGSRRERRKTPRKQWLKSAATNAKQSRQSRPSRQAIPRLLDELETQTVAYAVEFFNGEGAIFFSGEGIPSGLKISSDMPRSAWSFTAVQTKGRKHTTVTGTAPDSDNGEITVEVSNDGQVLSQASDNTFTKGFFDDTIMYTV
jgi:hypothetical protein